ncbi:MAG: glycoside hydrolase family 3 C-terminal domain-containing protein [Kiritimatiellae bacterium]|nr:glycoside hydrolase family 3 C-terminal domain-containing protein [Kiritimatiellia bacterium]
MKIAIYKDTFVNNRGADIAVKNLAVGLGERGHIVTLFDKSQFFEKVRGDYDVIISAGTNEILDLAKIDGLAPIVQQFHTEPNYPFRHWIKHWRRNKAIKAALKKASVYQVLSQYHVPALQRILGSNSDANIFTIGNSSAYEFGELDDDKEERKVILCPGAINKDKNQALLVDAFAKVWTEFRDWRIHIYGRGKAKDEKALIRRIASRGLENKVLLKGYADLKEPYKTCAFVAFPSKTEGFGMALLDAALFSKTSITIKDWIGLTAAGGAITVPSSVDGFAASLSKLMSDVEYRNILGRKAREFCLGHYSRTNILNNWEKLLMKTNVKSLAIALLSVALSFAASAQTWIDFNKNGRKDIYEDSSKSIDERVEDLLSQMTLEEKTCQMATLYGTGRVLKEAEPSDSWKSRVWKDGIANIDEELNGVGRALKQHRDKILSYTNHIAALNKIQRWFIEETRLGIPVEFTNEGIHGLNHSRATPLPAPIAIGSTWNRDLVREAGEIAGYEAKLLGYHSVYAPILDVARDQRWGRTLECYGEDPYHVGVLGVAMAGGVQSMGVGSCLKHFGVYGVPKGGRDGDCRTDPHVTPRELHEIHLAPFKRVIKAVKPMEVMISYNDWNGEPIIASKWFLQDILRNEYGFDGYTVSDSGAVEYVHDKHNIAPTPEDGVRRVYEAGLNVWTNFRQPENFIEPIRELVKSGRLSMDVVDARVRDVLRVKFRLGLFDKPYVTDALKAEREVGCDKHLDFVDRMGVESVVLLKNDGILPLNEKNLKKILVTGPLAKESNFMASRYGPNELDAVTVFDGLKSALKGKCEVVYSKGCDIIDEGFPYSEIIPEPITEKENSMMNEAAAAAKACDVIIAVMGEDEWRTGEGRSRTSLDLPGRQRDLLMRLKATGVPVVLVLINGQPLTINWENKYLSAILETWFPHCRGGYAIADILLGKKNPSGKLPVTFPKSIGQIELNFPYKKGSHMGQPDWILGKNGGGRTRVIGPLYPFGHGLSYTTFEYSDLKIEKNNVKGEFSPFVKVSLNVKNTGAREGAEVVQLYVRDEYSSVVTYDSVLRGFEKINLKPGETKSVDFTLTKDDLSLLDKDMRWSFEPGDFTFFIGSSSTDIRLKKTLRLD